MLAGGGGAQIIYSAVGGQSAPHAGVSPHYLLPLGYEQYDGLRPSPASHVRG